MPRMFDMNAHRVTTKAHIRAGSRVVIVHNNWWHEAWPPAFKWEVKTVKGRRGDTLRFEDGTTTNAAATFKNSNTIVLDRVNVSYPEDAVRAVAEEYKACQIEKLEAKLTALKAAEITLEKIENET